MAPLLGPLPARAVAGAVVGSACDADGDGRGFAGGVVEEVLSSGSEVAGGLRRWLRRNRAASPHDRLVAQSPYDDLVDALGYVP